MNQYSYIDYTGYKVDTFIIQKRNGSNSQGYALWEGVCELCGEKRDFPVSLIKKGHAKECACVVKKRQEDKKQWFKDNDYKITLKQYLWKKKHNSWHLDPNNLPPEIELSGKRENFKGQNINNIEILYPCGYNIDGRVMYVCKCFCGNHFLTNHKNLKNGNTKSCDCFRTKRVVESNMERTNDIIGKRFYHLYVESFAGFEEKTSGKRVSLYNCICDCGRHCVKQAVYLRCGDTGSCGLCDFKSKGESKIAQILDNNSITYKSQYYFKDCLSPLDSYLYFDFAILDKNNKIKCLIEFDGEQHYNPNLGGIFEGAYEYIHTRDVIKDNYCKDNSIKLYRIRFDENLDQKMEEIINEL